MLCHIQGVITEFECITNRVLSAALGRPALNEGTPYVLNEQRRWRAGMFIKVNGKRNRKVVTLTCHEGPKGELET